MAGPSWVDDDPADLARITANCRLLLTDLAATPRRGRPSIGDALDWHRRIYEGCTVPSACYVGSVRGDPAHRELHDYEVAVGPTLADGLPEKLGVWADDVAAALAHFERRLNSALRILDGIIVPGTRPTTVDELHEVVALAAEVHGEWVRIHPFANGNGRIARVWAAFIALRYGLPVFVRLKPRPGDVAYARAATASMGRPPDFVGDHRPTIGVFAHLLSLSMLP